MRQRKKYGQPWEMLPGYDADGYSFTMQNMPRDPASPLIVMPPRRPEKELIHQIGRCKLQRINTYEKGIRLKSVFIASWKADSGTAACAASSAREALQNLREDVPRPVQTIKGEIIGVRVWKLCGEYLSPVTRKPDFISDNPVLVADGKPTMGNKQGFWAIRPQDTWFLHRLISHYNADCWGFVGLFGRVVVHEEGWRAEKMVIRRVTMLIPTSAEFRTLLERRYGCEVMEAEEQ
jgi:hypothetical protein